MKLRIVTITGADDSVSPKALGKISEKYPFVEWGLLMARNMQGRTPRYPSLKWLGEFGELPGTNRSIHLSGAWARQTLNAQHPFFTSIVGGLKWLCGDTQRIQLNISPYLKNGLESEGLAEWVGHVHRTTSWQIIVQAKTFDHPLEAFVEAAPRVYTLQDASGGRGLYSEFTAPTSNKMVGFSGGLGTDNVERVLKGISQFSETNDYWIDMETKVRTVNESSDVFDLDKVEQILQLCQPFVESRI